MRKLLLVAILGLAARPAFPQAPVQVQISVGLPVAPPLVVIRPGIQVVPDHREEVFYTGGWYWVRRDGYWYRAPAPRATFVYVEPRRVPPGLGGLGPPGHYRHFRREQARAEERAWRQQEKERKRERKERERAERERWHAEREHGHGEGHDHGHHD